MTDESIINLSDETKSALRIYATMAGFFIIAATFLYGTVAAINGQAETSNTVKMFASILLLVVGVILAMLHKRDLFAAFFILFALVEIIHATCFTPNIALSVTIVYIIAALAFSQTRNEQRYIVVGLLLIRTIPEFMIFLGQRLVAQCTVGIMVAVCFYFALTLACERYKLPLLDYLTADEDTPENDGVPVHFKEMGSSIGFAVMSLIALMSFLDAFGICSIGNPEMFNRVEVVIGAILVLTGVIMMVAGRMRGTPFYFICAGFLFFMMSTGSTYVEGICFAVLGLMCVLRADARIMLGISFILIGVSGLLSGIGIDQPQAFGVIGLVLFAILTYLIFAVNSNGKLKLV